MSKLITDDCIKSFISKHYGKTSISGIGDGTVTGAISALNTKMGGFTWSSYNTENTTDSWVPVSTSNGVMQHRVIPPDAFNFQKSGNFWKYGRLVVFNAYNLGVSNLPTIPSGWRPPSDTSCPATILYNNAYYTGFIIVRTTGKVEPYYYRYGEYRNAPQNSSQLYTSMAWVVN